MIKNYKWIIGGLIALNLAIFIYAQQDEAVGSSIRSIGGREVEVIIDNFSGGVTTNTEKFNLNSAQMIKNFEIRDGKLVPYHDSESGDNQATTRFIRAFTFGNGQLWGYGVAEGDGAAGNAATFRKTAAQLTDNSWSNPTASSTVGNRNTDLFIQYKNFLYGAKDNALWRYGDITGTPAFTETWQAITFTHITQGVWHSKDDRLYIAYDNKIAVYDGGTNTWISEALILPTDKRINSIVEYGHFLAIGVATLSEDVAVTNLGILPSRVYLWDRNTSLTTVTESIDWGTGELEILGVIDDVLVGISHSPDVAAGGDNSNFNSKIVIRAYDGGRVIKLFELDSEAAYTASDLEGSAFKHNEELYFPLAIRIDNTLQEGIWKLYRPVPGAGFVLTLDRTPNNNTTLTNGRIYDMFLWDDYMFIAYEDGGTAAVSKTNDLGSYTASSTYESITFGDRIHTNVLRSIGVMTEPVPAGGQIDILFKMDGDRLWTLATTSRNVGSMFTEIRNNERDAVDFPQFTRMKFRVDSTGAATTTGFRLIYEVLENLF